LKPHLFLTYPYKLRFRSLKESATSFPPEFAANRVLPALISALDFGGASAASILPLVLELGKTVPGPDYSTKVLQPVVKLFVSPDRGTRMALLDMLPEYAEKLDAKTVSDKIWPHLVGNSRVYIGKVKY
jgi:SCY1-like protein 1